jgi:hypothetical protein
VIINNGEIVMAKSKCSPAYLWVHLSDMERAIWGSAYAVSKGKAGVRAREADRLVRDLRSVEQARKGDLGPEYEAARAGHAIEFQDFEVWYRVQLLIRHGHKFRYRGPTAEQTAVAYEAYRRGTADFY